MGLMPQTFVIMKNKYFNATGEIAFRLWMFANAVEALKKTPNSEKAANLKGKMTAFSAVVKEKGSKENYEDITALINEL